MAGWSNKEDHPNEWFAFNMLAKDNGRQLKWWLDNPTELVHRTSWRWACTYLHAKHLYNPLLTWPTSHVLNSYAFRNCNQRMHGLFTVKAYLYIGQFGVISTFARRSLNKTKLACDAVWENSGELFERQTDDKPTLSSPFKHAAKRWRNVVAKRTLCKLSLLFVLTPTVALHF